MGKGEGCEMHKNLNLSICRQLESCLTSKESRAVRSGAVGKVPAQATRRPPTLLASTVRRGADGKGLAAGYPVTGT